MTKIFYANNLLLNHVVYSVLTIRRFHLLGYIKLCWGAS